MNRKMSIGVCYYLPEPTYICNEYCIPIQLGFYETGIEMGIQKDNTGDNRSLKHPSYIQVCIGCGRICFLNIKVWCIIDVLLRWKTSLCLKDLESILDY